jgi:hypothetical protein
MKLENRRDKAQQVAEEEKASKTKKSEGIMVYVGISESDTPRWKFRRVNHDHKATKRFDRFCLRFEIRLATLIAL